MDRVFESGAAVAAPAAPASPSNGYATAGNPATATPATKPGPYWYHMITESLRKLVVDAGLTPDHTNLSLVSQAVQAMIAGNAANDYKASVRAATTAPINLAAPGATIDDVAMAVGNRFLDKDNATASLRGIYIWNGAAVAATRATDADGVGELTSGAIVAVEEGTANADSQWMLATDGAITIGTTPLAFTRKGESNFASDAEAQAFAVANKVLSPATLAAAFQGANQDLSANGRQKLPGGLIFQFGTVTTVAGADLPVNFPIAFPNNVRSMSAILVGSYTSQRTVQLAGHPTTTGFSIAAVDSSNMRVACDIYWFALGK
jgi:hypothetical protein